MPFATARLSLKGSHRPQSLQRLKSSANLDICLKKNYNVSKFGCESRNMIMFIASILILFLLVLLCFNHYLICSIVATLEMTIIPKKTPAWQRVEITTKDCGRPEKTEVGFQAKNWKDSVKKTQVVFVFFGLLERAFLKRYLNPFQRLREIMNRQEDMPWKSSRLTSRIVPVVSCFDQMGWSIKNKNHEAPWTKSNTANQAMKIWKRRIFGQHQERYH